MASSSTQMSAFISAETKKLVERYTEAHGVKKAALIESALLHHLQALRELPQDIIIPPRLVVTRKSGERLLERLARPRGPTPAMKALFAEDEAAGDGED